MKKEEEIGILYLHIHERIYKYTIKKSNEINKKDLFRYLGIVYHLPKNLLHPVLKELVRKGLVECIDKQKIKVLKNEFNLDDTFKIYKVFNFHK